MKISATFCLLALISSCGGSSGGRNGTAVSGEDLYLRKHSDGNTFACANCHALQEPSTDGMRYPGHQIGDAFYRPNFKNGKLTDLLDAVNSCRKDWMVAPAYTPSDENWKKLEAFLSQQNSGPTSEAISFEIVDPPTDLSGGVVSEGLEFFNGSCAICHGTNASGTERGPGLAGTALSRSAIARRVRTSGSTESEVYDGLTGGRMPFYSKNRISDLELKNVIAYLEESEDTPPANNSGAGGQDLSLQGAQSNCLSTHPKVGRTLNFTTRSHLVAGSATIVDDCTIRFNNFTYDGQGVNVRVYTGTGGNYTSGSSVSVNILGEVFDMDTATLRLPPGVSLDSFDGLSIWCVPFSISFGDGIFL